MPSCLPRPPPPFHHNNTFAMAAVASAAASAVKRPVLTFVTGNKHKLAEVVKLLPAEFPFEIVSHKVDLPELQGDPAEVSAEKCKLAAQSVRQGCWFDLLRPVVVTLVLFVGCACSSSALCWSKTRRCVSTHLAVCQASTLNGWCMLYNSVQSGVAGRVHDAWSCVPLCQVSGEARP